MKKSTLPAIKKLLVSISVFLALIVMFNPAYAGGSTPLPINDSVIQVTEAQSESLSQEVKVAEKQEVSNFPNKKDWFLVFVGALLGLASVWIVDKSKEPNLIFEVGSVDEKHPIKKWRFIHIKVKNLKRHKFNPFTTIPAFACKAIVKIGEKEFVGRWTSKEEPLTYVQGGPVLNVNAVLVHPREDIQPTDKNEDKESVQVAIGLKYESEDKFYGFNNESYIYQPDLKNPNLKYSQGEIEGEISVLTLGKKYTRKFLIHNMSKHRKDFWLELK